MARRRGVRRSAVAMVVLAVLLASLAVAAPAQAGPRKALLKATNKARVIRGIPRLKLNFSLSKAALRHTLNMAALDDLFHSDDVGDLLKPYRWWTWGENVGSTTMTAHRLHRAFMKSPGHRANVLNRNFRRVGIGAVRVDGTLWATLIFYG